MASAADLQNRLSELRRQYGAGGAMAARAAAIRAEREAIKTPLPISPIERAPSFLFAPGIPAASIEKEMELQDKGAPRVSSLFGAEPPEPRPSLAERAAGSGVEFREGAPPATRFVAGFSMDDKERLRAFQNGLSDYFSQPVDLRMGPDTGELEFYNPRTRRYTLANPPTLDVGDLASLGGDALVMIPEAAATAAVSFFTRSPIAGVAAGAFGAMVGDYARLKLGQIFGLNEDKTDWELAAEAAKVGGLAAAGGVLGTAAIHAVKIVANFLKGRPITRFTGEISETTLSETHEMAAEVNRTIGDAKLRFTAGQATGDPYLIALDEEFRTGARKGARTSIERYQQFDRNQAQALVEFYETINRPYADNMMGGPYDVGRAVQGAVEPGQTVRREFAQRAVEGQAAARDRLVTGLPSRPAQAAGGPVREQLLNRQQAYRRWAQAGASKLDVLAGSNFGGIPNVATHKAAEKLTGEVKAALIPLVGKGKSALVGERVAEVKQVPEAVKQLRASMGLSTEDEVILNKLFDPKAKFTFAEAWQGISALDRVKRISSKGLTAETPAVRDIKFLESALVEDVRTALHGTPLGEAWDAYRQAVRLQKNELDRSVIADIVGTREGVFGLPTEKIRDVILNASIEDAATVRNAIAKNPQSMIALQEGINDAYKEVVFRKGAFDRAGHERFMRQYGDKVRMFFPQDQWETLNRIGGFDDAVKQLERRQTEILDKLGKTFEGRLSSLEPAQVFSQTWKPGQRIGPDPSDIRELQRVLTTQPELLDAYRAEAMRDMGQRITRLHGTQRVLSANALDSYLHGSTIDQSAGRAEAIGALFGEQYRGNLETLLRALKTAQQTTRGGAPIGVPPFTSALNNIARVWTGMFTTRGRALTAVNRLNEGAANRVLLNAAVDPDAMQTLMKLRVLQPGTRRAGIILGQLGGTYLSGAGDVAPSERTVEEAR